MPRGPGQEEQQRRDRAPDDAGRVLRPGETEQKWTTTRKVWPSRGAGEQLGEGHWEAWGWASRDKQPVTQ